MNGLQRNRKHVREIISLVKLFVVIKQMLKPDLSNLLLFAIHFFPFLYRVFRVVYRNYETLFQRFFFLSQNKSFRQSFAIDTRKKRRGTGTRVIYLIYLIYFVTTKNIYPLPNDMKKNIYLYIVRCLWGGSR